MPRARRPHSSKEREAASEFDERMRTRQDVPARMNRATTRKTDTPAHRTRPAAVGRLGARDPRPRRVREALCT